MGEFIKLVGGGLFLILYFIVLPVMLIELASEKGPARPTVQNYVKDPIVGHRLGPNTRTPSEEKWYKVGVYGGYAYLAILIVIIFGAYLARDKGTSY